MTLSVILSDYCPPGRQLSQRSCGNPHTLGDIALIKTAIRGDLLLKVKNADQDNYVR